MKHSFTGGILLALPLSLLAFTACGDESIVKTNDIKQISEDDSLSSSSESSSSSLAKSSSSSAKSSKKSSSSKAEEVSVEEDDDVESKGDLPKCTISREGIEVYVKEEKSLYTCEEGEWIPEKKTTESSSSTKRSSSSKVNVVHSSSSAPIYIDVDFSSSSTKEEPVSVTGLGMCAPVKNPISKGESVTWRFTANTQGTYGPMDFVKATYVWDLGGLLDDGSGIGSTSGKVTYTSSGVYNASVRVEMEDGRFENVQCKPLQVNGDPITGCKCAPVSVTGSVDYTATPDVIWSVSGCTSASEIVSYAWDGKTGVETFTKTFTAATASYAPTLKVGNADNTVIDVPCSAVRVTEGAEYVIKEGGSYGAITFPAAGSYNVVIAFACQYKMFSCNGEGGPVGVSVNGSKMTSKDWYTSVSLSAEDCSGSATVLVEVDGPATCSVM